MDARDPKNVRYTESNLFIDKQQEECILIWLYYTVLYNITGNWEHAKIAKCNPNQVRIDFNQTSPQLYPKISSFLVESLFHTNPTNWALLKAAWFCTEISRVTVP